MASDTTGKGPLSEAELQELLSSSDGGARDPAGAVGLLIAGVALAWSVFQVVLASPVSNYVLPGALPAQRAQPCCAPASSRCPTPTLR